MKETLASKRGQALVVIALAMVAVVAIAAVTLDGGHAYLQRRRMQNAADAGALAGARQLALERADAFDKAEEYTVELNGADEVTTIGDCATAEGTCIDVREDLREVEVIASKEFDTWFGRLIGLDKIRVRARAVARWHYIQNSYFAPIALYKGKLGEPLDIFVIFDTDKEVGEVTTPEGEEVVEIAGANRGWLALDCPFDPEDPAPCSPDANSLKLWMGEVGYTGPPLEIGPYMGDPGSVTAAVAAARVGAVYVVPIYNRILRFTSQKRCDVTSLTNCVCEDAEGDYCVLDPEDPDDSPPDYPCRCEDDCCCTPAAGGLGDDFAYVGPNNCPGEESVDGGALFVEVYTTDSNLNGKYWYNVTTFGCFEVTKVVTSGPTKEIWGEYFQYWDGDICLRPGDPVEDPPEGTEAVRTVRLVE